VEKKTYIKISFSPHHRHREELEAALTRERTALTDFARQMFAWYPDAPKMCTTDSVGDYRSGYLGQTPSMLWDEQAYRDSIRGNQSRTAFGRISLWIHELREILKLSLRNP